MNKKHILTGCLGLLVGGACVLWYLARKQGRFEDIGLDDPNMLEDRPLPPIRSREPIDMQKVRNSYRSLARGYSEYSEQSTGRNLFDPSQFVDESRISVEDVTKYVISFEDFCGDDDFEKITLTYYSDGALVEDDQDVRGDTDTLIGEDSLCKFGGISGDGDVVYVRNETLKTDFEVVRVNERFKDGDEVGVNDETT